MMLKEELKQIRETAQLSIMDMGEFLGVDGRTVRRYEDGTRLPGGPVIRLYNAVKGNSPDFKAWLAQMVKEKK